MPKQSSGNYISTTPIPIIVNYNWKREALLASLFLV
jgi:hypothetical protein